MKTKAKSFTTATKSITIKATILTAALALMVSGANLTGYLYIPHMVSMVLGYGLLLTALVVVIKNLK